MNARALIIAIERYPASVELAMALPGTTAAAVNFFNWLIQVKGVSADRVWVCADGGTFSGAKRFATACNDIDDALVDLIRTGQDDTEELFVFISGHGYCLEDSIHRKAVAVFVASDFIDRGHAARACIDIPEMQDRLYVYLGGRHHYYFIDACRTLIRGSEISGLYRLSVPPSRARRAKPTIYTLFSTAYGDPARVNSDFPPLLVEGLKGRGRAKGYTPDSRLFIMFGLLAKYVQDRLRSQKIDDGKEGSGDGHILEIRPIPNYTATIHIIGAQPSTELDLAQRPAATPHLEHVKKVWGTPVHIRYSPSDFTIELRHNNAPLRRIQPPPGDPLDFFEDGVTATFELMVSSRRDPSQPPEPPSLTQVRVMAPPDTRIRVLNMATAAEVTLSPGETQDLPSGIYEVVVRERDHSISREVHDIPARDSFDINLMGQSVGSVHRRIVEAVGVGDPLRGTVAFSEQLGLTANRDLSLWLSIMGAATLVRDRYAFSKLRDLPLPRFDDMRPGQSRLFVLAGFEQMKIDSIKFDATRHSLVPVARLEGISARVLPAAEGPHTLGLELSGLEATTYVTYCLPNRVTFVVASEDTEGHFAFHQFFLPVHHLSPLMEESALRRIEEDNAPLRIIRAIHAAQRQFLRRRPYHPAGEDRAIWEDLLHGKWIDPLMSLFACYEAVRGEDEGLQQDLRHKVVPHLARLFPGIPDIAALATLLGDDRPVPTTPPVLREGLTAYARWSIPAFERIDFASAWTSWRGLL